LTYRVANRDKIEMNQTDIFKSVILLHRAHEATDNCHWNPETYKNIDDNFEINLFLNFLPAFIVL
jgi:hypothetical protein